MIIAFGYKKRTGKDTAANYLHRRLLVKSFRLSFARELKAIALRLWLPQGLKAESYYEEHPEEKEKVIEKIGKSPRQLWIELGNKVREIYGPTWLEIVLKEASFYDAAIISDLRFINEAKAVRAAGGMLIKMERIGLISTATDPAEVELDSWTDWDFVLRCSDGVENVHKAVEEKIVPEVTKRLKL